jgi:CO/xanthine dehydrogenase FAD-binding subunit
MLLVLPEFDLFPATSVADACSLLSSYGEHAKILAGGTDLLTKMKHKRLIPRYLVNIKMIRGLDQICYDERDGLRIGALATMQSIKESSVVDGECPALSEAAGLLGTTQVRNLATLGGNLVNASPSAECAPLLLTFGALIKCLGTGGERVIPLESFFVSPGKTSLRPDEILTEVHVPRLPFRAEGIYLKHSLRMMDVAMVGVAVVACLDANVCRDVRIALGAVAPIPLRATRAENVLRGKRLTGGPIDSELFEEAGRVAADECFPIDDLRAYAAYRKKIVETLVKRGLEQTVARFALAPGQRPR